MVVMLETLCAASSILFFLLGHDSTSRTDSMRVLFMGSSVLLCPIPTSTDSP